MTYPFGDLERGKYGAIQGMKWRRTKLPKPTGQRAKAAFEAWRLTLTPRQRRSLYRPPRR